MDTKPYVYDSIGYVFTHYHDGTNDQMTRDNFLYVYTIDLDRSKSVESITLPDAPGVKIAAISVADSAIPDFAGVYQAPAAFVAAPPTNVTASVIESNQNAYITWTAPEATVSYYRVYAGLAPDFSITGSIQAGAAAGMSTSFIYEPYNRRDTFYFKVVAFYPDGSQSEPSLVSNAVTAGIPPSTECDIIDVDAPLKLVGTNITASVSNHRVSINMTDMIRVSDKATWAMYSNAGYTTLVSDKSITGLVSGDNVRYVRVTAQDGITRKDYVVTITRRTDIIGRFATAPPMDGTLDPAVWGGKVYSLALGAEGVNLMYFYPVEGYPPAGFKADVYLAYDAANLYLGMIVNDPLWQPARAGTGTLWQGCGIQVNVWSNRTTTSNARSEYGFGLTATNPAHWMWATASGGTSMPTSYNNYSIKRVGDTDTYIYTIAIPLNSFRSGSATNPLAQGQEPWFSISYNYPNQSVDNMICAFNMGFMAKNINEGRALTLGPAISTEANAIINSYISGDKVESVTLRAATPENTVLYLAAYNESGAMVKVQSYNLTQAGGQEFPVDFDFSGAAKVKAFMWDKTMVPLTAAKDLFS